MNSSVSSPIDLLQDLASKTLGDKAIEQKQAAEQIWRGFTFQMGEFSLAFPFMGGFEILPDHEVQPMPWAQEWVRGIANVRGEIYTVVDFSRYLGLAGVSSPRNATLFMLPDQSLRSVLMIDSRVNLKSFVEHLDQIQDCDIPPRLKACTSVSLKEGDLLWHVVDVVALCQANDFVNISRTTKLQ